jgi:hypothetical protein
MLEKPELHWRELDLDVAARDAARETIEAELTDDQLLAGARRRTAPQQTAHACLELFVRHRLHDVAICAGIEPAHDCLRIFIAGVQQDGSALACPSQLLENLEAVTVTELEIENDSIILIYKCEQPGILTRVGNVDRIAIFGQNPPDQVRYTLVIFGNQNTNGTNSS